MNDPAQFAIRWTGDDGALYTTILYAVSAEDAASYAERIARRTLLSPHIEVWPLTECTVFDVELKAVRAQEP